MGEVEQVEVEQVEDDAVDEAPEATDGEEPGVLQLLQLTVTNNGRTNKQ